MIVSCSLLLLIVLGAPPAAQPRPLQAVLDEAAASQRPALLYFSEVWCEPCREVEAAMQRDPELKSALGRFVVEKYDSAIGLGYDLSNKYLVNSIPAFVVVDASGKLKAKRIGGGRGLVAWLDQQAPPGPPATLDRQRAVRRAVLELLLFGVAVPIPTVVSMAEPDALWGAEGSPK
jgi:thiol-disulfide isomerase/thioredoxin